MDSVAVFNKVNAVIRGLNNINDPYVIQNHPTDTLNRVEWSVDELQSILKELDGTYVPTD